jgi:hypothetical protein
MIVTPRLPTLPPFVTNITGTPPSVTLIVVEQVSTMIAVSFSQVTSLRKLGRAGSSMVPHEARHLLPEKRMTRTSKELSNPLDL